MDQPAKTPSGRAPRGEQLAAQEQQRTVLLSDAADALTEPASSNPPSAQFSAAGSSSLTALAQRYDILGEAGHGNMGNVYKARDRETGETVALKLIKPEIAQDQAMMERFKNELLFARKITHKNVCRVYDFNRVGGTAYTSMEFVEGESLRSVLNRFGSIPVRKGIDLALQICSGLKEAHAQGIVHRDLKPENVMVDAQGNVKIMDFGIARSMEAGTRLTGSMIGTPAYMAPEQVAGKSVDYRTDIYSLGLILYEMFTGSQAFQADTPVAVALKQIRESPAPPHEVDPTIPVFLERAVLKCLEKEPEKRFPSVAQLEQSLRANAGTPVAPLIIPPAQLGRITATAANTSLPAPSPKRRKHALPLLYLALGAFAVLAAMGGTRAMGVLRAAAKISPPAPLAAPEPPKFALEIPVAPPVQVSQQAKAPAPQPPKPSIPVVFPSVEYGQSPRQQQIARREAAASGPIYLFVGRFEREEKAQGAASQLENLGFPSIVLPRHTRQGQF